MLNESQIKALQKYLQNKGFTTVKTSGAWDINTQNCYDEQCKRLGVFHPTMRVQPVSAAVLPLDMQNALEANEGKVVKSQAAPPPVVVPVVTPAPVPAPAPAPAPELVRIVTPESIVESTKKVEEDVIRDGNMSKIDPTLE